VPKLNSLGDVICGVGGVQGSLNQRPYPFSTYGRGCWLDDETILVSLVSANGALYGWQPFSDPPGSHTWLVDSRPFNVVAGGGGKYLASIETASPVLYGSLGTLEGAGAGDVSFDGTMVYKTHYFANSGLTVVPPGGASVSLPGAYPLGFQALMNGQAIWPGGAQGRAPARPYFTDAMNLRLATLKGQDWLVYWSQQANAVVLQPDGGSQGYVFVTQTMFDADMIALGDFVVIASSTTQGEGPDDLTRIQANESALTYLVGSGPVPAWGNLGSLAAPI
jgi:hypothetical protein